MKEIREIIRAYDACVASGKKMALASVVHLEGSSYRRPGARMLVDDEGQLTGAISGGCLEGDALRKALLAISQQQGKLVTYDTSDEDDMSMGVQLGCAGVIQVLFQPVDPADPHNAVALFSKIQEKRQNAVLATLVNAVDRSGEQPGTCLLLLEDGTYSGRQEFRDALHDVMQEAMDAGSSRYVDLQREGVSYKVFIEFVPPAVSLVIIGAGNDAMPLVDMANILGWDARVVDGRSTHARVERFTSACQVMVSKPEAVLEQLEIDSRTVFVLMTHNYNYDLAMLRALLPLDIPYVGSLGPRKKLDRMLDEIREDMLVEDRWLEKLYGPVGLDIGAETAEEIALSIVAEIKAVLANKKGSPLREKAGTIHSRPAETKEHHG